MKNHHKSLLFSIAIAIVACNFSSSSWSAVDVPIYQKEIKNLAGTLEIRAALYLNDSKKEAIQYLLRTNDNDIYVLQFSDHPPKNIQGGDKIRLFKAYQSIDKTGDKILVVASKDFIVTRPIGLKAIPDAFGPQNTIVFLVNFQNNTSQPWTMAQVNAVVFTGVNNAYNEDSYHQTTIIGNTIGWYTLPLNTNVSCDQAFLNQIGQYAAAAASSAGIDLTPYKRRIYMFPNTTVCSWAGLGTIGINNGKYSETWLNGYNNVSITKHEVGHNLGMWHSHSLICDNGTSNTGNCTQVEYGDYACNMGSGNGTQVNVFQKEKLGWLNYQNSPPIQTITQSGNYNIDQLETTNNNVKALKILKQNLSDGSKDYYYVEFRTATGIDAPLNCTGCDFVKGVLIHQGNSNNGNTSNSLDMSPTDTNHTTAVALLPGASFTDPLAPNGGATIKLNSITTTSANVTVTFGSAPPPCIRSAPTMAISPNTTQIVAAGSAMNFSISIKNNDSNTCSSANFNFYTTSPFRIISLLTPQTLTLLPGQSSSLNLGTRVSSTAYPATYSVIVKGVNMSDTTKSANVTASLQVQ